MIRKHTMKKLSGKKNDADDLHLHWDRNAQAISGARKQEKKLRNIEEYLDFLTEFEPFPDDKSRNKYPKKQFTLD